MVQISTSMTDDHRRIDGIFVDVEKAVAARDWAQAKSLGALFQQEMEHHFSIEEERLFPALEQATSMASGPIRVMTMEHDQMRYLINNLQAAIAEQSRDQALGVAETLLVMIQQHNIKEENVLYPMADTRVQALEDEISKRLAETA